MKRDRKRERKREKSFRCVRERGNPPKSRKEKQKKNIWKTEKNKGNTRNIVKFFLNIRYICILGKVNQKSPEYALETFTFTDTLNQFL